MDGSINFSGTLAGSIADGGGRIKDVKTNASGDYETVVDENGIAKIDLSNYTTDEQLESAVDNINSALLTKQNIVDYSTEEQNTGVKWIDGVHYIYKLVIPFTNQLTTNNWIKVATITNDILSLIDAKAINTSNYDFINVVADFDTNDGIYVNNRFSVAYTPTHIIVEYIKFS